MASNRYGRIYHSESSYINIRFPSVDARREYAEKFQEYHAGHEHDGAVPRFEEITAATIGGFNVWDIPEADSVSIDGYKAYEIEQYHERQDDRYIKYDPPTCCVPPLISIEREFVDSSTLTRHELSAVFGDMPEQDYQSLLESIRSDGIMDEVIRLIGDEVLDGWHRYRAARELNLIRTLRFQQWDTREDYDGDPAAFVLARNIERRHLTPGQRAQIVVSFADRFDHGGDRSNVPSGTLKNRKELAEKANVGERTISRAVAVEKAGKSEAVITGEKSASEVLKEREAENAEKDLEEAREEVQASRRAMWNARDETGLTSHSTPDEFQCAALKSLGLSEDARQYMYESVEDPLLDLPLSGLRTWRSRFDTLKRAIEQKAEWTVTLMSQSDAGEKLEDSEKTDALEKFRTQKRDVYDQIDDTPPLLQWKDEFGNTNSDKALHRVMLAAYKHYDLDEALLFSDQAIQDLSADEICKLTSQYYLIARDFDVPMADWVLALLEECGGTSDPESPEDAVTTDTSTVKITAEEAAQMERDYPTIENPTAEPESDKQDPTYDEWKEKWLPQLVDVFQSHGVEYGSVAIDRGVMKDYEKWPWDLSVEQLKHLITESKTVVEHPKIPEIAWKRNRGKEGILWALDALGLNKESVDETTQEEKIKAILGDDTLNFITVCLRNPDRTLNYVSFDGEGGDDDRPMSDIPENILLELLKIAKNSGEDENV